MELTTRIFNLDASPYDADIFVDGEKMAHPYPFVMHLGENTNKTVEVKKEGYLTKTEVFYNQEGKTEALFVTGCIETEGITVAKCDIKSGSIIHSLRLNLIRTSDERSQLS